jgi:hypothetical protein
MNSPAMPNKPTPSPADDALQLEPSEVSVPRDITAAQGVSEKPRATPVSTPIPNSETARAIVTSASANWCGGPIQRQHGKALAKRFELVRRAGYDGAFNALCVAMLLWQARGQLGRGAGKKGSFMAWVAEHVAESAHRTCTDYMKLGMIFAETTAITRAEAHAMIYLKPRGAKTDAEKTAVEKLSAFIGDLSIFELMVKHGVRGVGLKSALTGDSEETPALTAGEQMELVWSQAYKPAKTLADLLTEKAASLDKDKRDVLAAELKRALQAIEAA